MSRLIILSAALLALAVACAGNDNDDLLEADAFRLPWAADEAWFFVGGPHCDSPTDVCPSSAARYALDFAPRAPLTGFLCDPSENDEYWVTAAAAGVVRIADRSLVEIEHGDGIRTGYYHLRSSSLTVAPGDHVEAAAPLGNPSCEHRRGGAVPGPHVHFYFCATDDATAACLDDRASLLAAEGRTLSGWRIQAAKQNYFGSLVRGDETRTATALNCSAEDPDGSCAGVRNDLTPRRDRR
ncbi:MAG: M23 family metallopeptidase [Chloroflexi bacterium]|nr:M23 family metallopeptidase [Chloroflexota bacterium]